MPVFLPTTLQGAEQIIHTMKDMKSEAPSNTSEAAIIIDDEEKPGESLPKCAESHVALLKRGRFRNESAQ